MIQRFTSLPVALRVLVVAVTLGALLVLVMGLPTIATNTAERFSSFLGGEEPRQANSQADASAQEGDYLTMVEDIQAGSVDSFLDSDETFTRYDSVTPEDHEQ